MTHDRREHDGEYPATLVEVTAGLPGYPAGTSLEDVLRGLHRLLSRIETVDIESGLFTGDAYLDIDYELGDTYDDCRGLPTSWIPQHTEGALFETDVAAFTGDDPPLELYEWTIDATTAFSSWVRLIVDDGPVRLRIHTIGSGMVDTTMAIFKQTARPAVGDLPWHLADDSTSVGYGLQSSIHEDPQGSTHFVDGDAYNEDYLEWGVELENGVYWVVVWPYDGGTLPVDETDVKLTIERVNWVTGDAMIANGLFTGDAVVNGGSFTGDAYISGA